MKTYLTLIFDSEGTPPSEIRNQLLNLGFKRQKEIMILFITGIQTLQQLRILFGLQIRFIQH